MSKIIDQALINIGSGRRVTLPSFVECEHGQQMLMQQMEDGTYNLKFYSNAPKIKIFGVMIGRTNRPEDKKIWWWGIFIDNNGNILARKKSSTLDYLRKDMSLPDVKMREKLDRVCGLGLWEPPILIEFSEHVTLPRKAYVTARSIRQNLIDGTWPPVNE